jgi:hypothetical protein
MLLFTTVKVLASFTLPNKRSLRAASCAKKEKWEIGAGKRSVLMKQALQLIGWLTPSKFYYKLTLSLSLSTPVLVSVLQHYVWYFTCNRRHRP